VRDKEVTSGDSKDDPLFAAGSKFSSTVPKSRPGVDGAAVCDDPTSDALDAVEVVDVPEPPHPVTVMTSVNTIHSASPALIPSLPCQIASIVYRECIDTAQECTDF
jgi:hypothetical protein